ncbi:hypothetical protein A7E77_04595 [Sphingomonas sp. NIC1]|jgi:predicted RecB family nuclease|nr:hypothetical protein A7E77_04595 [Sphingomonas sp. NIC1]
MPAGSDRMVADGPRELDGEERPRRAGGRPAGRVTATMLADLVRCEQRVHLDLHGDPERKGEVNGFVEMLWAQGCRHEADVLDGLGGLVSDLRDLPLPERYEATVLAMSSNAEWILGARLVIDDLEGRPDLLRRVDGVWFGGDVKSGGALAPNGRDPRLEYAVQTGFYADVLGRLGLGGEHRAFVIGSDGTSTWYDLDAPMGRDGRTVRGMVASLTARARAIRDRTSDTRPALSSICGLCVWKAVCKERLLAEGDLTLIPGLGRSVRSSIEQVAASLSDLAELDIGGVSVGGGRTVVPGVGASRLATFRERARMLVSSAAPFATRDLGLARRDVEHHLDLETDPTAHGGDFTYLHGIWRRRRVDGVDEGDYVHFLADRPSAERDVFAAAIDFLTADPSALLTTFSAFERSTYRRLAARYPEVIDAEGVEAMFSAGRCVDLYFDVVLPLTHWPTHSLGLKAVARHLGFDWNDPDAGGASSIQWFVEWMRSRDPGLLDRILTYNRNDCLASAVVFDGALALPVMPSLPWPRTETGR